MPAILWFAQTTNQCIENLKTSLHGLNSQEAEKRIIQYGENIIKKEKTRTPIKIFFNQFTDFMILILIAAAIISGIVGEPIDAIAILVIVLLNALIGFFQEYRAEKALAALNKMAEPMTVVLRDQMLKAIKSSLIVPGDIVSLETGNIVPADIRLIECVKLNINEAALTGESVPSAKSTAAINDASTGLADRRNMAYKGTMITQGRGIGVVTETGMSTELGKIAILLGAEHEVKTPLQRRLNSFSKKLAIIFLGVCLIVFLLGIVRRSDPSLMFLTAVSLAVAVIPEALPAVITVALAIGAKQLARSKALIHKLAAVETLGSVTYVCTDKTGTLTQNKMQVVEVYADNRAFTSTDPPDKLGKLEDLMLMMAISNDAHQDQNGEIIGDPTEVAMCITARNTGFDKFKLSKDYPRIDEIPFDPERKLMTTFHKTPAGDIISCTKGAIDTLLKENSINTSHGLVDLNKIKQQNHKMAGNGLRVLAITMKRWKKLPDDLDPEKIEKDLIFLGLIGLIDPPREEVSGAIELCKTAGIKPVMITGDHPVTAVAIANRLGITDSHDSVITGSDLEVISDEDLKDRVEKIAVYARVAPVQKLKIVKALQEQGQYVAMTGDGVNDAPALKRADIGIAMGITGTDVSKQAAHMILLDDNFATIIKAIKEGRRIFDNIRKFIMYILSCNLAELWAILIAPFLGLPLPLLPIQILWINLVTDSLPALALAAEPQDKNIMNRPPRNPGAGLFAEGLGSYILIVGIIMAAATLSIEYWAIRVGWHWPTMTFTVLCFAELGNAFVVRSEKESFIKKGLFTNLYMLGSVITIFLLQLAVIYTPFLNRVFKTKPLSILELFVCIVIAVLVMLIIEVWKIIRKK